MVTKYENLKSSGKRERFRGQLRLGQGEGWTPV